MKKLSEITLALAEGKKPVVTFLADIGDKESYAEPNMRARLVGVRHDKRDEVLMLTFDFEEFSAFNKAFEIANYYDKAGNPTLTASEAGCYKPQDEIYFDTDEPLARLFEVLPDESEVLFNEFKAAGTGQPYIAWLESLVLKARSA